MDGIEDTGIRGWRGQWMDGWTRIGDRSGTGRGRGLGMEGIGMRG